MRLTPIEAEILARFSRALPVGEAMGQSTLPADLDMFSADLRRWFHQWTAEGFFLTVAIDRS